MSSRTSMTAASEVHGNAEAAQEMLDWEVVQEDWWKTSFRAISWSYKAKPGYPRPPHYHNLLARGRRRRIQLDAPVDEDDVDLNHGLCGVQAAEEALKRYEVEVSILSPDDLVEHDSSTDRCLATLAREKWDEKVQELLGGILKLGSLPEVDTPPPDAALWDLNRLENDSPLPRSPSTAELTDSETSVESDPPPSTPKPTKSYARVVSSESVTSPTVLSPLPSKLLSASALTFIPSTPAAQIAREPVTPPLTSTSNSSGDSSFSSPTYNFHFPSLQSISPADRRGSRSLPPSLQKDESGFYVEVPEDAQTGTTQSLNATRSTTPRRPSAALLPAFLTDGSPSPRPRNSKTREIVDRLRSSGSSNSTRKAKKSERARRQASSSAAAQEGEASPPAHSDSKAMSGTKGDDAADGWISGSGNAASHQQQQQQQPQDNRPKSKHAHSHKRSSGSAGGASSFSPASQASGLALPHTPARSAAQLPPMTALYPTPTGTIPYVPYGAPYAAANPAAAYMPMQHPMQARAPQWMGFQAPGMYPMYQSFGMMPPAPYGMVPVPPLSQPPAFYDAKGKPGGALVQ